MSCGWVAGLAGAAGRISQALGGVSACMSLNHATNDANMFEHATYETVVVWSVREAGTGDLQYTVPSF